MPKGQGHPTSPDIGQYGPFSPHPPSTARVRWPLLNILARYAAVSRLPFPRYKPVLAIAHCTCRCQEAQVSASFKHSRRLTANLTIPRTPSTERASPSPRLFAQEAISNDRCSGGRQHCSGTGLPESSATICSVGRVLRSTRVRQARRGQGLN